MRRPRLAPAAAGAAALAMGGIVFAIGARDGDAPAPVPAPAAAPAPRAAAGGFTRGPYLTRVTTTTARLRWRAAGPVRVTVTGPDGRALRAPGGLATGLAPGTRYRWTATPAAGAPARGAFTTAPRRLDAPLTLVAFGDYGAATPAERAVGALAARLRPRLLVTTGDNSYLLALEELLDRNIFRPLRAAMAGAPNVAIVGDHDLVAPGGRDALVRALDLPGGGERYDLRYGPVQVIGLGLRSDPGDLAFTRRALARPGPAARLVTVHRPLKAGDPLLPVLRGRADVVLSGHLHAYERRVVGGVLTFTVGTGGADATPGQTPRSPDALVYLATPGLLRIDLAPGSARYRFLDVRGRVRDAARRPLRSR